MARYTGPRSRIARKFKEPIYGADKVLEKKAYPPGQHGFGKKRGSKQSEYSEQLQEKQKAKYTYGILERQFRKTFAKASHSKGITGVVLLQLVESRLDNVVYRMGIAPSRNAARQLVSHCHIAVNGKVVNVPSYTVKPGFKVAVREKSKSLEAITRSVGPGSPHPYPWIEFNPQTLEGTYISLPERAQIPENIREQLIVELYSK
ncbi:MAG: 30S ribosomal protein S4 [Bacteroidia bacterium]|jgi:small subunit ribosomal protein S4|nr:30S ribosomal protein S4 [Bacteroidia bacterium]